MLCCSRKLFARRLHFGARHMFGSPGAPWIKLCYQKAPVQLRSADLIVEPRHPGRMKVRVIHYLGKHVPHPQKSLWSPDTPVVQDRHLYMLNTIDIDAFKYWFGVKRAMVDHRAMEIFWRAGLLPPSFYDPSPSVPRPIFDKEPLYKYYLRHRKTQQAEEAEEYANYHNSMKKSEEQRAAERPKAPWL